MILFRLFPQGRCRVAHRFRKSFGTGKRALTALASPSLAACKSLSYLVGRSQCRFSGLATSTLARVATLSTPNSFASFGLPALCSFASFVHLVRPGSPGSRRSLQFPGHTSGRPAANQQEKTWKNRARKRWGECSSPYLWRWCGVSLTSFVVLLASQPKHRERQRRRLISSHLFARHFPYCPYSGQMRSKK